MARRGPRPGTMDRVLEALSLARRENLYAATAARRAGVSLSTMRRYAGDALRVGPLGRLEVAPADRLPRTLWMPTREGEVPVTVRGSRVASELARLHHAVKVLADPASRPEDRTDAAGLIERMRGRRFGGRVFDLTPAEIVQGIIRGILRFADFYVREET